MKLRPVPVLSAFWPLRSNRSQPAQTGTEDLQSYLHCRHYTSIKLMKYPTGHLWTEVKINGMIGRFILDTGVASTAIERRRIDYFDIKVIEYTLEAIGAGGAIMPVRTTTGNNLQLGDYADGDFPLKLVRFDKVNQALRSMQEPEVDGIIGNDLLEGRCAIIDYKNLTLYLKK